MWYFENQGQCGIRATKAEAVSDGTAWGERPRVRRAAKDDIAWVRAMGGYVPAHAGKSTAPAEGQDKEG